MSVDTDYIRRLADDFEESGHEATAQDFRECAENIDELRVPLLELEAMGAIDAEIVELESKKKNFTNMFMSAERQDQRDQWRKLTNHINRKIQIWMDIKAIVSRMP